MSDSSLSFKAEDFLGGFWLVVIAKRFMGMHIPTFAYFILVSLGAVFSVVAYMTLLIFVGQLAMGTSVFPVELGTSLFDKVWEFYVAAFMTCFFVVLVVNVVYVSVKAMFVSIKNGRHIGYGESWSPFKVVLIIVLLMICVFMSGSFVGHYYDSKPEGNANLVHLKGLLPQGNENEGYGSGLMSKLLSEDNSESTQHSRAEELVLGLKIANDEINHDENIKLFESTFNNISLFKDEESRDWDAFLEKVDSVSESSPTYTNLVILEGVGGGAPFETLIKLLDRGYEFNGSVVSRLASKLSSNQIMTLENYGVDFTLYSGNSNALINSLINRENEDVYDYLLQKDELVFSENVDVLKQVIELSMVVDRDFEKAEKLYKRGAKVTEETRDWIEGDLKDLNFDLYLTLKEKINL